MTKYRVGDKYYDHPAHKTDYDHLWTDVGTVCPDCGVVNPYRHVADDSCQTCHLNTFSLLVDLVDEGTVLHRKVCARGGHLLLTRPGRSKCLICATNPSPRQAALASGDKWYPSGETCPDCNELIMKRVENGRARCGCKPELSPRQAALASGEKWYGSNQVCKECDQPIMRRVENGRARCGCRPELSPRQNAVAAGEKWYPSGEVCSDCGEPIMKRVTDSFKRCGC